MTLKPSRAQLVLERAEADRFEQDHALVAGLADPVELGSPVVDARDHAGHRARGQRLADRDPDLVAFGDQPQVERSEVAGFGDAEDAHRPVIAERAARRQAASLCRDARLRSCGSR